MKSNNTIVLGKLPTDTGKIHQKSEILYGGWDIMHDNRNLRERPSEGDYPSEEKRLGNLNGFTGGSFAGQVYHPDYLSPSLTTMGGGGRMPHVIVRCTEC